MKIAVIAANGKSGRAFVYAALDAGHEITAGTHHSNPFPNTKNLVCIPCDATNKDDVHRLLAQQDAVVSFIGHTKNSPADVQTKATATILSCMQEIGIKRFVSLTGTGVRFPGDIIPIIDRILNATIKQIDPARISDGVTHAKLLQSSDLNWTLLRVLKLTNQKPKDFTLKNHGPGKLFVSRAEVAQAALEVLENNTYIKEAPIIG